MNAREDIAAHFTSDTLANQLLDAHRAEVLDEQGPDDLETVAEAAQMYRSLRPVIERTMADPDRWDGDEDEAFHLGRYVQWLAAERAQIRAEALNEGADAIDDMERRNAWPVRPVDASTCSEFLRSMTAEKGEKSSREADATPDFFQVGHTYTDDEYGWKFRVDTITTHPEDGERTALGWRYFNGRWAEMAYGEDDWEVHQAVGHTDVTEDSAPAEAPTLTVYRASHEAIAFGLYTTAQAAREHCEAHTRRDSTLTGAFNWVLDDPGEDDSVEELTVDGTPTGYIVTPLTVASEYDEEADE